MTLDEMKAFLRVDSEEDDDFIGGLMEHMYNYIDSCVGNEYKKYPAKVNLADLLVKKFVKDVYDSRGSYVREREIRDKISASILDILAI